MNVDWAQLADDTAGPARIHRDIRHAGHSADRLVIAVGLGHGRTTHYLVWDPSLHSSMEIVRIKEPIPAGSVRLWHLVDSHWVRNSSFSSRRKVSPMVTDCAGLVPLRHPRWLCHNRDILFAKRDWRSL